MKVNITPKLAGEWLNGSEPNYRILDKRRVDEYATMMQSGDWEYNGETIKRHPNGNLLDGNHRLHACIQADVAFVSEVVIVERTLEVDRGKGRRLSDALRHRVVGNAPFIAGVLNWCWKYAHRTIITSPSSNPSMGVGVRITEIPGFAEAALDANHRARWMRCAPVGMVFVMTRIGYDGDQDVVSEFWDGTESGVDLSAEDPRLILGKRLSANVIAGASKLSSAVKCALTIKAFNAFVEDRPVKCLKWSRLRKDKEAFPEIIGCSPGRAIEMGF